MFACYRRLGVFLILVLCAQSLVGCRPSTPETTPNLVTPSPEVVEEPPAPVLGAVFTIVTAVADNAPAASLDHLAFLNIELEPESGEGAQVLLPMTGETMVGIPEAEGTLRIRIEALDPNYQRIGMNEIQAGDIGGTVGTLRLTISSRQLDAPCEGCTPYEALISIPTLHETSLRWSAVGQPLEQGDQMGVEFQPFVAPEVVQTVWQHANRDGQMLGSIIDGQYFLASESSQALMDTALRLARMPEVRTLTLQENLP
ncbi:MAG: hypothetical protein KC561_00560 [Myxococcales bacterium]|nr:hypothetical protein [Myxococcales bacterium]